MMCGAVSIGSFGGVTNIFLIRLCHAPSRHPPLGKVRLERNRILNLFLFASGGLRLFAITQQTAQDLAGRRLGNGIDKLHLTDLFVVRNFARHEIYQ